MSYRPQTGMNLAQRSLERSLKTNNNVKNKPAHDSFFTIKNGAALLIAFEK